MIEYNDDNIVTANLTVSDYTTKLPDDHEPARPMEVTYTYSVTWSKTEYGDALTTALVRSVPLLAMQFPRSALYSDREKAEIGSLQVCLCN